jgi:hypothetical protein
MTKKSNPAVSLTLRDQILAIFESIFSANTKPYAKRLQPVNQGPRGDCLIKKTEGRKSRDTLMYKWYAYNIWVQHIFGVPKRCSLYDA